MYMFIVLGRLGCKQVICLGYVYVLWLDPHVAHTHVCAGKVACSHDHSILAQALMLDSYRFILKTHPPIPMLIATKSCPDNQGTGD